MAAFNEMAAPSSRWCVAEQGTMMPDHFNQNGRHFNHFGCTLPFFFKKSTLAI